MAKFSRVLVRMFIPRFGVYGRILAALLAVLCGIVLADRAWIRDEAFEALVRIDPLPHTRELLKREHYAEAHDYLAYFMEYDYVFGNPEAQQLYEEIQEQRSSALYRLQKAAEGAFYGRSDEIEGQVAAVASDFFLIGDIRDLVLEGQKWWNHAEVDTLTVALSSLGVAASAGTAISGGSSAAAQPALSFLKMANKVDMLPPWLRKSLIRNARLIKETRKLDRAADLFETVHTAYKTSGARGTLLLVNQADDLTSLKKLSRLGTRLRGKTAVFVELTGSSGMKLVDTLDDMPKSLILEASTFGKRGVETLERTGAARFQRFLRTTKISARTGKVLYKHHEALWNALLAALRRTFGRCPSWLLGLLMLSATRLSIRWKRKIIRG